MMFPLTVNKSANDEKNRKYNDNKFPMRHLYICSVLNLYNSHLYSGEEPCNAAMKP